MPDCDIIYVQSCDLKWKYFAVAQRLASVYGFLRLSLGDAIRFVLNSQPESELALKVQSHLLQGLTVPDELAIQALNVALLNHMDNPTG